MPSIKKTRAVAAFLLLGACGLWGLFRNEVDLHGLAGPVHTMRTQTIVYEEDGSARPSIPNSLDTYNPEGFRTEEIQYDADGTVLGKTSMVRDGWNVLEEFTENLNSSDNHHLVRTYDVCGKPSEMREYDASGSLRRKVVYDRSRPRLVEEKTYDGEGTLGEHGLTFVDHERRVRISRRYLGDGRLKMNWRGVWDEKDRWVNDNIYYPKGALGPKAEESRTSRKYHYRGNVMTIEVTQERGGSLTKQWVQRNQKDGRTLRDENIYVSSGQYSRDVNEYDARQQPLLSASYDQRGLQRKTTSAYEYDARGNWIKKTDSVWTRESNKLRVVSATERRITYY